jgi:LuxR family maltose regulon positive regulatory protein
VIKTDKSSKRAKPKVSNIQAVAKISRPRIGGIVQRERLFRLLDGCQKYPIVYVCGPAGSGKTTLIGSYLDFRKIGALWYQVDEGDSDIATFFYYLGLTVKQSAPRAGPLSMLTPEYLLDIPTFTLRYFEKLFANLTPPFALVFDSYQQVPEGSKFHEVVGNGLGLVPEGIQVFIISRLTHPPVFSRLYANDQMKVLGWDDLRLTLEESAEIIRLRAKGPQAKEVIESLHEMAGGWVGGLVLLWESWVREGIEVRAREKFTPREMIDYFGSELFEKIDGQIRDFLLKTAFLPSMTGEIAEKVTGDPQSKEILLRLNRDQLFTERKVQSPPAFQYHPLFREFLFIKAKSFLAADEIRNLRQRSAQLLEAAGQIEEAANLFIEASDWEGISQIIVKNGRTLIDQGRNRTLEKWLNRIPKEVLNHNPWLLYWLANSIQPFRPSESLSLFERAFELFEGRKDVPGSLLAWIGAVDTIQVEWDDFTRFDRWIEWLTENFGHEDLPVPAEVAVLVSSGMVGALQWRRPDYPDEIRWWVDRLFSLVNQIGDMGLRIRAYTNGALYYLLMFDSGQSKVMIEEIGKMTASPKAPPLALITWKYLEAAVFSQSSSTLDQSLQSISEALEISRKTGVHILDPIIFSVGVLIGFSKRDWPMTQRFLGEIKKTIGTERAYLVFGYHFLMGWYNLLTGKATEALRYAETALELAEKKGGLMPVMRYRHLMSLVLNESHEYAKAASQLNLAKDIAQKTRNLYVQFVTLLTEAQFAFERGEQIRGVEVLRSAFEAGRRWGITDTSLRLWWRPAVLAHLCGKALEAGIEVEYARKLIRDSNLLPDSSPLEIDNWPWPVKIFTLGRFGIFHDEKPVGFSRKVQQKPLAMLKVMIALGGKEVKEEQLSDILWPEAEGDDAHNSFITTQHRLRQLIGHERAIRHKEERLTLDERQCWVDVWAFEWLLETAEAEKKRGSPEKAVQCIEKAIDLYKGPFLADEIEQSWMISPRERLRSRFIRNLIWLGHYWQEQEEWEKAIESFQRGLEIDDVAEDLYQKLMICYRELGRRSEALSIYHRCRKTLSTILGVDPSPKTEAIYKSLNSGGKM